MENTNQQKPKTLKLTVKSLEKKSAPAKSASARGASPVIGYT